MRPRKEGGDGGRRHREGGEMKGKEGVKDTREERGREGE